MPSAASVPYLSPCRRPCPRPAVCLLSSAAVCLPPCVSCPAVSMCLPAATALLSPPASSCVHWPPKHFCCPWNRFLTSIQNITTGLEKMSLASEICQPASRISTASAKFLRCLDHLQQPPQHVSKLCNLPYQAPKHLYGPWNMPQEMSDII